MEVKGPVPSGLGEGDEAAVPLVQLAGSASAGGGSRERDELETISALARSLVSTLDLDEMLSEIAHAIGKVLRFHDCVLYLWEPEEERFVQRAAHGPKSPAGNELVNPLKLRRGQGIVGSVGASGKPEVIDDVRLEERFIADVEDSRSEITVPITFQGEVIGIIDAESTEVAAFSHSDLTILERFADLCAPALVNARRLQVEKAHTAAVLRQSEERYRVIIEQASDAIYTADAEGRLTYANPASVRIFGSNAIGRPLLDFVAPEGRDRVKCFLDRLGMDRQTTLSLPMSDSGGAERWTEQILTPLEAGGRVSGFQAIVRDVTERRHFELQLLQLANHDTLTGLLNRHRFEQELESHLAEAQSLGLSSALLWLDLDHFKDVNDSQGHKTGDQLLVNVSALLRNQMRRTDTVARFGGDEFAVLMRGASTGQAEAAATRVLDALRSQSFAIRERPVRVTASIGLALIPEHGETSEEILSRCDLAMYEAKDAGRNCFRVYAPESDLRVQVESRVTWVKRLREALDEGRFELFAQPIRNLGRNSVARYELLLRLRGEEGRLFLPSSFMKVAERFGLIHEIDRWVVCEAIRLLARDTSGERVTLEVNLSGKAFSDEELLPLIRERLSQEQVDPARLVLEITETAAVSDMERAQRFIASLRELGCRFAIDDFGVGFSSFFYLKHLPIDYLKIDGSFIRDMASNEVDRHLVRSMVEVAKRLGKKTIAESVESEAVLELLSSYGVDYAQGEVVGEPQPGAELLALAPESRVTYG